MTKKNNIEYIKESVRQIAGYTLLDDKYINNKTKMTAIDDDGYKYYFTFSNLKFAKSARMVDKSNPYSIENIKLWMKKHCIPYELLSDEYIGNGSKNRNKCLLKLKCVEGHIFYRTWNDILKGIRCEECEKRFNNHNQFVAFIKNKYHDEYEILSRYINSQTKVKVKHNKCGTIFESKAEHLANGHGCPNSLCCKKRGKEHYRYNENLTDEDRINDRSLSNEYRIWRINVHNANKFSCDICGSNKNIVAHHLNSWDINKDDRYDVSNGVTLCKECHINFHRQYGFGKNTSQQYYEYKNNHDNTEVIYQIAQG